MEKLPDFRAERKAYNPVTSLAVMVFFGPDSLRKTAKFNLNFWAVRVHERPSFRYVPSTFFANKLLFLNTSRAGAQRVPGALPQTLPGDSRALSGEFGCEGLEDSCRGSRDTNSYLRGSCAHFCKRTVLKPLERPVANPKVNFGQFHATTPFPMSLSLNLSEFGGSRYTNKR